MNKNLSEKIEKLNKYNEKLKELKLDPITNKENINKIESLIFMLETNIEEIKNPKEKKYFNISDYFKPEYREGGYFCSKDFEEKCEMFDKFVEENNMDIPKELRGEALKIFLKENFNIDWEWDENKRLLDEYKDEIKIVY